MAVIAKTKEVTTMSVTLKTGATGFTVTGGTDKVFSDDGQTVTNGKHMADFGTADFRVRPHITFKNRNPQKQTDGTFSKGKRETILTIPILKSNGTVGYNTWRYSQEYDAEISAATEKDGRFMMAQLQFDSETESFNAQGALPV